MLSAALAVGALAAVANAKMNIITILTDDQGFGDNGYYCENSTGALHSLTLTP